MASAQPSARPTSGYAALSKKGRLLKSLGVRFKLGFIINSLFMLLEYGIGFMSGSLILIADATHNLTDSITLAVSWLGNMVAKKPADSGHSFGHGRSTVLAAFLNSSILLGIAILIFVEAYRRFLHPIPLEGGIIAVVSVIGIIANGSVALLFRKYTSDINVRAAYINMAFDAVFSVAAFVAGLLILWTNKTWIDPFISIGIGVGLLFAATGILRQALHILLEGVPKDIDLDKIRRQLLEHDAVLDVGDIYAWTIASNEHIICCSLVLKAENYVQAKRLTSEIKKELLGYGLSKVIIETA